MKKKCAVVFALIIALICSFCIGMAVSNDNRKNSFDYRSGGEIGVIVTNYKGKAKNVKIPEKINGQTVIGVEATFTGNETVESVTLPDTLQYIYNDTFSLCKNLKKVTFSSELLWICNSAFKDCTSLTEVNLPNKVEKIEDSAFYGCTALKSVTLPQSLTRLEANAFGKCSSLTSVVVPKNVEYLDAGTFGMCTALKTVKIQTAGIIYSNVFDGCKSLSEIKFTNDKAQLYYIKGDDSVGCITNEKVTFVAHKIDKQIYPNVQDLTPYRYSKIYDNISFREM